jgi:hypothetical protein
VRAAAIPTEMPTRARTGQNRRTPRHWTSIVRIATTASVPWIRIEVATKAAAKATRPPPSAEIAITAAAQITLLAVRKAM